MHRIFSSLDDTLLQQLDAACTQQHLSRSELVRLSIEHYLQHDGLDGNAAQTAELQQLRIEVQHYKDTIGLKDHQISFLEGHVSQLTQSLSQLALTQKTEEERAEIKKKPRWKFW